MQENTFVYMGDSMLVTPLGVGLAENFSEILLGHSGIRMIEDDRFFSRDLPLSKMSDNLLKEARRQFNTHTRFDSLLLKCVDELQQKTTVDLSSEELIIILSTTKGNVELLAKSPTDERLLLSYSAQFVQHYVKNPNTPIIISNACISGLSAMIAAKRLLLAGHYKKALVIGCDVLTSFVIKGFNSFHAISRVPCKPFDLHRTGINLGEAAAAVILSTELKSDIVVRGGCITNDANHISGPSKTGEELSYCLNTSLLEAGLLAADIDFISAHGTATNYNDEMESKAFDLSGLHKPPVFSFKAIYGHTLGASAVLEAIISAECLKRNIILPSYGFEEKGVSGNITVSREIIQKDLRNCLKSASGFGGCNAALILQKQ